jgi:putative transposase
MARTGRIVIPGCPHHIVHRGNRGAPVFLAPEHRSAYCQWLGEHGREHGLRIWAYCLMTNHVHLIGVPGAEDSLSLAVGNAHGRYAQWLNAQQGWVGHLWAGRFFSAPMDEHHLWAAAKYVETNPVRARLVGRAEDYAWSSAAAHALGRPDSLLSPDRPFPDRRTVGDWAEWLAEGLDDRAVEAIRMSTKTGRPLGSRAFVAALEERTGRVLTPRKPGRRRQR